MSPLYLAAMVCAINGGATAFSHVNDSGFWLVSSLLEIDEKTTLKSWTMMETIIGITGLVCAIVISLLRRSVKAMKIKVTLGTMQNASKLVSIAESISCDVDLCYGRYIVDANPCLES